MAKTYSYDEMSDLIKKDIDRISDFYEIPEDLISLKPEPKSWSACEIIQHINKFNGLYMKELNKAIESGEPVKANSQEFKPRFIFRQFIHFLEPPYRLKLKTIAPMYPNNSGNTDPEKPINELKESNIEIRNRIDSFREKQLDLNKIKGNNPVLQWVSMSLTEFILILEAHQRRHFWQLQQTLLKLSGDKY
ncbi:MAG: DinB family protein [Balneolaceae bacterium]|nr:DinB family protein [Balneolaceae bacterium]